MGRPSWGDWFTRDRQFSDCRLLLLITWQDAIVSNALDHRLVAMSLLLQLYTTAELVASRTDLIYTVFRKTPTYVFDYNSDLSWSIFILFVPMETEMNTLQKSYQNLQHHPNCVSTLPNIKQHNHFETTVADRFLHCIRSNRLFAAFAESHLMFIFLNLILIVGIFCQSSDNVTCQIFWFLRTFDRDFVSKTQYI